MFDDTVFKIFCPVCKWEWEIAPPPLARIRENRLESSSNCPLAPMHGGPEMCVRLRRFHQRRFNQFYSKVSTGVTEFTGGGTSGYDL